MFLFEILIVTTYSSVRLFVPFVVLCCVFFAVLRDILNTDIINKFQQQVLQQLHGRMIDEANYSLRLMLTMKESR